MKISWCLFRILAVLIFLTVCWETSGWANDSQVTISLPDGDSMPGRYFRPEHSVHDPIPGILVAANVGGLKLDQYQSYCKKLANQNYAVLLIDATNFPQFLTPGHDTWRKTPYQIWAWTNHLTVAARLILSHQWYVDNIKSAVDYLANLANVDRSRLGLSGFSQSANAVLAYASGNNRIKCVVWNNGGWPWVLPYEPSKLPPVLIFHGEKDGVYDVKYARQLASELDQAQRDYECHIYPGQRHMFNLYYDLDKIGSEFSQNPIIESSFEKLCVFLERFLQKDSPVKSRLVRSNQRFQ
ncbi:MAG: dienelactone hydrolase family protein [Pseudomonadota bacterium]